MEESAKRARVDGGEQSSDPSGAHAEESGSGDAAGPQGGAPLAGSLGPLPAELRAMIEQRLADLGEVKHVRRIHRKGAGPVRPRCLPTEDLVHEKTETVRRGGTQRIHFRCSNPKCEQEIRNDKERISLRPADGHDQQRCLEKVNNNPEWDAHVIKATSDLALQVKAYFCYPFGSWP